MAYKVGLLLFLLILVQMFHHMITFQVELVSRGAGKFSELWK